MKGSEILYLFLCKYRFKIIYIFISSLFLLHHPYSIGQNKTKDPKKGREVKTIKDARIDGIFIEACTQMMRGDLSSAEQMFKDVLKYDAQHHASLYYIGRLAFEQREFNKAIEYCKNAIKIQGENFWYHKTLKEAFISKGDYQNGINTLEKIIQNFPDRIEERLELIDLYVQVNNSNKALEVVTELEEELGNKKALSIKKYRIYAATNQYDQALSISKDLLKEYSSDEEVYLLHYEILQKTASKEEIIQFLNEWLQEMPENSEALTALANYQEGETSGNDANPYLAQIFANTDVSIQEKVEKVKEIISKGPENNPDWNNLKKFTKLISDIHPNEPASKSLQGDIFVLEAEWDTASIYYRAAIEDDPSQQDTWFKLLNISFHAEDYLSLQKDAEYALEFFPNNVSYLFYFGLASSRLQDFDPAIYALNKVQKIDSESDSLVRRSQAELAQIYAHQDNITKADELFSAILTDEKYDPFVQERYAHYLAYYRKNDRSVNEALEVISKVLTKFPNNASYIHSKGWVLFLMENYTEAETLIRQAIAIQQNPIYVEHLGDVLFRLGKRDEAIQQWERAKTLGKGLITIDLDQKLKNP